MEIKKLNANVRCDIGMCRKQANYSIARSNTLLKRQLNICEECAQEIYKELGKLFTPKSPQNVIGKKNPLRGEK